MVRLGLHRESRQNETNVPVFKLSEPATLYSNRLRDCSTVEYDIGDLLKKAFTDMGADVVCLARVTL